MILFNFNIENFNKIMLTSFNLLNAVVNFKQHSMAGICLLHKRESFISGKYSACASRV